MARKIGQSGVIALAHANFASFLRQREEAERLDLWSRGDTPEAENVFAPRATSPEYKQLSTIAGTPWISLIITALVQTCFLEGVRAPGSMENLDAYTTWQRNGWDAKQTSLYRSTMSHGAAFGLVLPGKDPLTSESMPVMRARSALRMAAFFDDDDDDGSNWPTSALEATQTIDPETNIENGWMVRLYDEQYVHFLSCRADGLELADWSYLESREHPAGVTPVVTYPNAVDLDGRITSATEPLIPLAKRIDQDTFDRLIVQRFGAWKVRTIAGMAKPDSEEATYQAAMNLKIEDLLVSESKDTKFGTLEATDLAGFIAARDSDLRDMSAVSQTPPHHMLGLSSNLQAEALAAAEAGLQRKSIEHKTLWGERHEQMFRLTAKVSGNAAEAAMFDMQVRWRDMESRSFTQAADALVKLEALGVPAEMLWERIPNWTDADTTRAKKLLESQGIDALLAQLEQQLGGQPGPNQPVKDTARDGQDNGNVTGG